MPNSTQKLNPGDPLLILQDVQQSLRSTEENEWLQGPFTEEEVLVIIKQCNDANGFTMDFFKKCQDILKEDLMLSIQNFHPRSVSGKSLNATFIVLIPKKPSHLQVADLNEGTDKQSS